MKKYIFVLLVLTSALNSCSDPYLFLSNRDITERDQTGTLIGNVDPLDWGLSNNIPSNIKKMFVNGLFSPLDTANIRSGCSLNKDIRIEVFPNPAKYWEDIRLNILNSKGLFKRKYINVSHLKDNSKAVLISEGANLTDTDSGQYFELSFFQGTPNSRVYYMLVDTNDCYYWGQGDIIFK